MLLPILITLIVATSSVPADQPFVQLVDPKLIPTIPVSVDTVRNHIIPFYADFYDVPRKELDDVIGCESSYFSSAKGDHGHARGLVQINDIYHPEVDRLDALNPFYSVNFLAKALKAGKGHEWTCWRKYYGNAATSTLP